jgi:hypothetical protein
VRDAGEPEHHQPNPAIESEDLDDSAVSASVDDDEYEGEEAKLLDPESKVQRQ